MGWFDTKHEVGFPVDAENDEIMEDAEEDEDAD
jgi:hypothetical protein